MPMIPHLKASKFIQSELSRHYTAIGRVGLQQYGVFDRFGNPVIPKESMPAAVLEDGDCLVVAAVPHKIIDGLAGVSHTEFRINGSTLHENNALLLYLHSQMHHPLIENMGDWLKMVSSTRSSPDKHI